LKQGYEVFRNVSPAGLIDVVAVKGGETLFLDIKSWMPTNNNLRPEQASLGVRLLWVLSDGTCQLMTKRDCPRCGDSFMPMGAAQKFCSRLCLRRPSDDASAAGELAA
jgi:hypothetical protein